MDEVTGNNEHSALAAEVLALESEVMLLRSREQRARKKVGRVASVTNRTFLYLLFGPRLTRGLGALLHSAKNKDEPLLGSKLANVLDAASRRMTGYKRWALVLGLLAATPGAISVVLLWQQNAVVKRETQNTLADIESRKRLDLLLTIYTSEEKDAVGAPMTPKHPASLRKEASLALIKMDTAAYRAVERERDEEFSWRVDLSYAPLGGVNYTPLESEALREMEHVRFSGSNFYNSSFSRCSLRDVWFLKAACIRTSFRDAVLDGVIFNGATLIDVDFSGAEFKNCDFKGAIFNQGTRWPEGFDPIAAGAVPMNQNTGGGGA